MLYAELRIADEMNSLSTEGLLTREDIKRYRQAARQLVHRAVKMGRLKRPQVCEDCSRRCKAHAHHDDYSKPLEVRWLCPKCHYRADWENGGRAPIVDKTEPGFVEACELYGAYRKGALRARADEQENDSYIERESA